jgi:MFS family permease
VLRLALALFAAQAGFHAYTTSLPLSLSAGGVPDPTIGLIVGSAALVQVPAAFIGGSLLDRFGGVRLFHVGALAYVLASLIVLLPGVEPDGSTLLPFVAVRILQGIGLAMCLPAALSLVPRLVPIARRGIGLAVTGTAQNLTLLALPPLSLAVLRATSLDGVAVLAIGFVAGGILLIQRLPFRSASAIADETAAESAPRMEAAGRRFGFAFRRSWGPLLAITLLYVAHWGVVTAYLPQRAAAVGADIGLFFVADGLGIVLIRVPSGWLADRVAGRWLIGAGLGLTALALVLLLPSPTTAVLLVSGLAGGLGGGLVLTPLLLELSRRSSDADRGSAFSLFSGALAGALSLGSIGGAPVMAVAGFEVAIALGIAGVALAAAITALDRGLARRPAARPGAGPDRPVID